MRCRWRHAASWHAGRTARSVAADPGDRSGRRRSARIGRPRPERVVPLNAARRPDFGLCRGRVGARRPDRGAGPRARTTVRSRLSRRRTGGARRRCSRPGARRRGRARPGRRPGTTRRQDPTASGHAVARRPASSSPSVAAATVSSARRPRPGHRRSTGRGPARQPPIADIGRLGCRKLGSLIAWPGSFAAIAIRQRSAISASSQPRAQSAAQIGLVAAEQAGADLAVGGRAGCGRSRRRTVG